MTNCSFKGCRPTSSTDVGFLVKFFIGTYGLMLWEYQKHDVIENGWLIFYLDDEMKPRTGWYDKNKVDTIYLDDVHLQIAGIASTIKVPHIDISEVV